MNFEIGISLVAIIVFAFSLYAGWKRQEAFQGWMKDQKSQPESEFSMEEFIKGDYDPTVESAGEFRAETATRMDFSQKEEGSKSKLNPFNEYYKHKDIIVFHKEDLDALKCLQNDPIRSINARAFIHESLSKINGILSNGHGLAFEVDEFTKFDKNLKDKLEKVKESYHDKDLDAYRFHPSEKASVYGESLFLKETLEYRLVNIRKKLGYEGLKKERNQILSEYYISREGERVLKFLETCQADGFYNYPYTSDDLKVKPTTGSSYRALFLIRSYGLLEEFEKENKKKLFGFLMDQMLDREVGGFQYRLGGKPCVCATYHALYILFYLNALKIETNDPEASLIIDPFSGNGNGTYKLSQVGKFIDRCNRGIGFSQYEDTKPNIFHTNLAMRIIRLLHSMGKEKSCELNYDNYLDSEQILKNVWRKFDEKNGGFWLIDGYPPDICATLAAVSILYKLFDMDNFRSPSESEKKGLHLTGKFLEKIIQKQEETA